MRPSTLSSPASFLMTLVLLALLTSLANAAASAQAIKEVQYSRVDCTGDVVYMTRVREGTCVSGARPTCTNSTTITVTNCTNGAVVEYFTIGACKNYRQYSCEAYDSVVFPPSPNVRLVPCNTSDDSYEREYFATCANSSPTASFRVFCNSTTVMTATYVGQGCPENSSITIVQATAVQQCISSGFEYFCLSTSSAAVASPLAIMSLLLLAVVCSMLVSRF